MSEHTPGPWQVRDATPHVLAIEAPRDGDAALICYMIHTQDAESRANARLIAAAPTMERLLHDLSRWHGPENMKPEHVTRLQHLIEWLCGVPGAQL